MPETHNIQGMLAEAERAASTGDLVSAEELLRNAAQLQEKELGPTHPDLANTLNNLAIVAETAGRLDDADTLYRRAVAITSASLPPDDPMVAASRRNLEDFCRAHSRPLDRPAVSVPAPARTPTVPAPAAAPVPTPARVPASVPASARAPAHAPTPAPVPPPRPATSQPPPTASRPASRAPAMIAMAVVALVILTLLVARPWSRIEKRQAPAAAPATQPSTMSAPPGPAPDAVSPTESLPAAKTNRAPASAAGALAAVQLCRSFSTSDWRCVPAGDSVAPGPIVLYTRVRSPREDVIVHRWYHGEALVKSAQLRVGANATEGYRTYSRQTVDHGDWRVEVRSAAGDLLHEQRFAVQ